MPKQFNITGTCFPHLQRTLFFLLLASPLFGQSPAYQALARQADSLFHRGEFAASGAAFSQAFEMLGWRGYPEDRFTAARAWSRAGVPDSAFFQLQRLLDKTDFLDKDDAWTLETDFDMLQNDLRWQRLTTQWHLKQERMERAKSHPLSIELEAIHVADQYFRIKRDSVQSVHGLNSPEMKGWTRRWIEQDSLNYLRVNEILETSGWLGPDAVTEKVCSALYLVVQHAPLPAQEKWLPAMREAVKNGKAKPDNLAYLEDRVLMRQGKPQRYGSQITSDKTTGEWILHPVEDPANLDARPKSVGLGPIQLYLDMMGAKWKQ